MIILLDENFPLRFYNRLQKEGFSAEHILLTHRGIHDRDIFIRLRQEELLFLTQDEDFVDAVPDCKASIIWSRVSQSMVIDRRVDIWLNAVNQFLSKKWAEKFFELYDDGKLHPVEVIKRDHFEVFLSASAEKKTSVMRALAARDVTDNIGDEVWSLNVEPLNLEPPQGFERSAAIERLERLEQTFRDSGA